MTETAQAQAPPDTTPEQHRTIAHMIFGPPGTGKTYTLTERVRAVVASYGPDSIVVCSFSVTAAKEIASRGLGLPDRSVGTLHSQAFRAIGHEWKVALDPKVIVEWNKQVGRDWQITADNRRGHPQAATEGGGINTDSATANNGDEMLAALDKARATYVDPADYDYDLRPFATAWTKWKQATEVVDYTDMIEMALDAARDGQPIPGNPMVLVVDEAQDMTRLEVDLALAWGALAHTLVVALDDDQAIMEWRGADPAQLLDLANDPRFEVRKHVLDRSRRVPRVVHAVAEQWVRKLSRREEKVYHPRTTDKAGNELAEPPGGAAFCVPETLGDPELVHRVDTELEAGRSVMIIAPCMYMLTPLLKNLKEAGIPFANRYRPSEPRWNPFGTGNGMSTAERVFRYLVMHEDLQDTPHGRPWTGDDVRSWLPLVSAKEAGLRRGVKARAEALPDGELTEEDVAALFADQDAFDLATNSDPEWFAHSVLSSKEHLTAYPLQVVRKRGVIALATEPQVTVGTIHSVKGGASDVVYLSPELSGAGMAQLGDRNGVDQMVRLFYVGMTRAYEELRLVTPSHSNNFVRRRDLLPAYLEVMP